MCAREGARSVRAVSSARPVTLAKRAPEGGDLAPLICRCATFKLPQLGGESSHSLGEKTPPKVSPCRGRGKGGRKRDPHGVRRGARKAGRAGADFPLWVVPVSTSSVLEPADEEDGQHARQKNTCWDGREAERLGRVAGPCLPPGRARAAPGRARGYPAESRAGQRAGVFGRRERRRRQTGRSLGLATGDPRPLASTL